MVLLASPGPAPFRLGVIISSVPPTRPISHRLPASLTNGVSLFQYSSSARVFVLFCRLGSLAWTDVGVSAASRCGEPGSPGLQLLPFGK